MEVQRIEDLLAVLRCEVPPVTLQFEDLPTAIVLWLR